MQYFSEAERERRREAARKIGKANKGKKVGFAANPELARIAGARGGRISRRSKSKQQ